MNANSCDPALSPPDDWDDWLDKAFPLPPPDVMEAINRQLDRDIAAEAIRRVQRRGSIPPPPEP